MASNLDFSINNKKNLNVLPSSSPSKNKSIFNIDFSFLNRAKFVRKNNSKIENEKSDDTGINELSAVNVRIYSFRLNHLFKSQNKHVKSLIKKELKLKRARDLVHSLSALYDNCLPDIGPSSIYDCICAPKSFTICIVKEEENEKENDDKEDAGIESVYGSNDCLDTVEESNEEPNSIFKGVYSDMEDESSIDEDDDSNEEDVNELGDDDYSTGIEAFLKQNSSRKSSNKKIPLIKNLIGCATLQRTSTFQLPAQDEWIIDLQLMCVRKMYRGFNIGKYLLNSLIKNPNYVGIYDAIVTSSDVYATKFYEKYGFQVDPILNSKYAQIGDIWTNTTKMCYLSSYCLSLDHNISKTYIHPFEHYFYSKSQTDNKDGENSKIELSDSFELKNDVICELTSIEKDYKKWQKLMFSSYQYQSQLFTKLKQEIGNLKANICAKDGIIDDLKLQNQLLLRKNAFLKLQLDKFLNEEVLKSADEEQDDEIKYLISKLEAINEKNN